MGVSPAAGIVASIANGGVDAHSWQFVRALAGDHELLLRQAVGVQHKPQAVADFLLTAIVDGDVVPA